MSQYGSRPINNCYLRSRSFPPGRESLRQDLREEAKPGNMPCWWRRLVCDTWSSLSTRWTTRPWNGTLPGALLLLILILIAFDTLGKTIFHHFVEFYKVFLVLRFNEIKDKLTPYLKKCGFNPRTDIYYIPVSGLTGVNLKETNRVVCPWYEWVSSCRLLLSMRADTIDNGRFTYFYVYNFTSLTTGVHLWSIISTTCLPLTEWARGRSGFRSSMASRWVVFSLLPALTRWLNCSWVTL